MLWSGTLIEIGISSVEATMGNYHYGIATKKNKEMWLLLS
jgi:hypothetical protein